MTTHTILVIEDSDDDYLAFQRAVRSSPHPLQLERCRSGAEAQDYIQRAAESGQWPSLVFLDLNMPGIDGRTLLRWLRGRGDARHLRLVVYSTSDSPSDIAYCYSNCANAVHTKPAGFEQMRSSLLQIIDYWLSEARLPSTTPMKAVG